MACVKRKLEERAKAFSEEISRIGDERGSSLICEDGGEEVAGVPVCR